MKRSLWSSLLALLLLAGCCGGKGLNGDDANNRKEAPKHDAPDQEQVDSLKQDKLKEKVKGG